VSDVRCEVAYHTTLTGKEFRLVALALAGKLKAEVDRKAAVELSEKLARQRAIHAEQLAATARGAIENIEAEKEEA
jgi:hypothetical protein